MYVDEDENTISAQKYGIYVSKFDRQLTHLNTVASAYVDAPDIHYDLTAGYSLFVDCDLAGKLAIAYNVLSSKYSGKQDTLSAKDNQDYSDSNYISLSSGLAVDNLLSTYSTTTVDSIAVKQIQVAGSTLLEEAPKIYKPMQEAGFFLAT